MRAWSFRIFSILGLFILGMMNIGMGTKLGQVPYFMHSLSASLPMMNIKLVNVYQGIIAAFLASDFIKRDRKYDTTQVVYIKSMTNADYITGKILGILLVFAALNAIVIAMSLFFHIIFSDTPFAWQPYLYFTIFMSLPTLIFVSGLATMLMNLFKNQAVVFVLLLALSIASLVFFGQHMFYVLDIFAFYMPLMYSDLIGLGNFGSLLLIRGSHFLLGAGLLGLSILLMNRLRQSKLSNSVTAILSVFALTLSALLAYQYVDHAMTSRDYRQRLVEVSAEAADIAVPTIVDYSISLDRRDNVIHATAEMSVVNENETALDSLFFSLNPGLEVLKAIYDSNEVLCRQNEHLMFVICDEPLLPGDSTDLTIEYSGIIDERASFLDLTDETIEERYSFWMFSIPKRYAYVGDNYVILTQESLWYPVSGLSDGASYPRPASHDFAHFKLNVGVDKGMVALSQGETSIDTTQAGIRYNFDTTSRLPQISLIIGPYRQHVIEVDSIEYSLSYYPNHDFFAEYFDSVSDTIPALIREMKTDYQMQIGLDYPYRKLALVEVPINFYSYDRLFSFSQESVQPQMVLLPELGAICEGTDFNWMKRRSTRMQERANQAQTKLEIQAKYFSDFVKIDLLGIERGRGVSREDSDIDPRFHILPNFISYCMHLSSPRWPVINYALESYIFNRATPPQDVRWRSWQGLTEMEKANLLLRKQSLKDVISGEFDNVTTTTVMKEKGRYLFTLLEMQAESETFQDDLTRFIDQNRFSNVAAESLIALVDAFTEGDVDQLVDSWYADTLMPGYDIRDIEGYKVVDKERTRTQVKFTITNSQPSHGVITVGFRAGQRRNAFVPWWRRGLQKYDYQRMISIPGNTKKEIGILLDDTPSEMVVETYVSLNIPSVIRHRFGPIDMDIKAVAFDGERVLAMDSDLTDADGELIVDNEDKGFNVLSKTEPSRLRKFLLTMFSPEEEEEEYKGLWFWRPPNDWVATTDSRFYGDHIHSGFYKASGDGSSRVEWSVEIEESGNYDLYYYNPDIQEPSWARRNRNRADKGEQVFLVYHEDGVDEIKLNLNAADEGWNILGSYHLLAGKARVELTDENSKSIVTADALKFVRQ